jgi:formylglycine-generating enzyme
MDQLFEQIAKLPWIKELFKSIGIDNSYTFILSLVLILVVYSAILFFRKKVFEWHNIIKKARDLKPEFEKNYIKDLSKIFIRTTAAQKSPNRHDNPDEAYKHTGDKFDLIDFMLKKSFNENVESDKYYLVLADSGMGKTAFMLNLYLQNYSYLNFFGFLTGKIYTIKLFRFQSLSADKSDDILERIKNMSCDDIPNTILLLDGLDEDPFIFSKDKSRSDESVFKDRVNDIVEATRMYKEVVITCRTQYFPQQEDDLYELSIRKSGGGFHTFQKYYIYPFSDSDVHNYLNKKYKFKQKKKEIALQVVKNSKNLLLRPMLMSYIDLLIEDDKVYTSSVQIYDALIEKWLEREGGKWKEKEIERKVFVHALKNFSVQVAIEIYNNWLSNRTFYITKEKAIEIAETCEYPIDRHEATGKSLLTCDAKKNWKFSHKSILEFILAKKAAENVDFAGTLDFSGMNMARSFGFEFGINPFVHSNYIEVKGDEFLMGSPADQAGHEQNETQHRVKLADYLLYKFAVCVGDFKRFIDDSGYQTDAEKANSSTVFDGKSWKSKDGIKWCHDVSGNVRESSEYNHPVLHVSWNDAGAYCRWLSKKTGNTFRLPTEAEWEFACRAGSEKPFHTGDNLTTGQANYNGNFPYKNNPKGIFRKKTSPVDSFEPNAWGLYNMHGNVWEWCSDRYGENYYDECKANGIVENPEGPKTGSNRVIRGGSWGSGAEYCRSASRGSRTPDYRDSYVGFRLVFLP